MRAYEFLKEVKLDIPDQMVSVQIPLSAVTGGNPTDSDTVIVNPGIAKGKDGRYKWSPPLQQQLDTAKDSVGPSNDEITDDDAQAAHNAGQNNQGEPIPDDQVSGDQFPEDEMKKLVAALKLILANTAPPLG